jgi:hypothetical protein
LMRCFRRSLVAVCVALGTLAAASTAVTLSVKSSFIGTSKHKHYGVTLRPECFTIGCKKATTLGIQVRTGNIKHPAGKCVYAVFQLPNAPIRRNGKFTVTGDASTVATSFKLKVSGVFLSPRKVRGTVTGPKVCGGSDTFRLTASKAGR